MPRVTLGSGISIELNLPVTVGTGGSEFETCAVCMNEFCDDDACCRSVNPLDCCSFASGNALCAQCTAKIAKRCKCRDECDAVVLSCPLCREMTGVEALALFQATKPLCERCLKRAVVTVMAEYGADEPEA